MQNGRLVEHADTDTVFESPQQEYTQTLLNAIPGVPPQPAGGGIATMVA